MRIAGVDEAGRGPLAGPVVAAAVILGEQLIAELTDSKLLTENKRARVYQDIVERALSWSVAWVDAPMIDQLNIHQATLLAMQRAVEGLAVQPQSVLVDGLHCPPLCMPCQAVVRGDRTHDCIAAASVIAKVTRDRMMHQWDLQYPDYGFARHKGYATALHYQRLAEHGPIEGFHRQSFRLQAKC